VRGSSLKRALVATSRALLALCKEIRETLVSCEKTWSLEALIRRSKASSGDLLRQGGRQHIRLHIPNPGLQRGASQRPEWRHLGGFLGLPKESFITHFHPFGDFTRGK